MISSVILLAVVACAHAHTAQTHTVFYYGENAQSILENKEPGETLIIPAGECEMEFPLKYGVGCLGISALKIEVEDEGKVFIELTPDERGYVARFPDKCGSPATVTFSKKCIFYPW